MPYKLLTAVRNSFVILACWLVCLAAVTERITVPLGNLPLMMVLLAGCFLLCGPLSGAIFVILLGLAAEMLSPFPAGRMAFAVVCAGLVMLHLLRITTWSVIGRGFLMCSLGAMIWQLLVEFYQLPVSGLSGSGVAWQAFWQAGLSGACWLIAAVLVSGVRVVWKEAASRPVRFGANF